MAVSQKLLTDEQAVIAANRTFYAALHSLDLSLMGQVWLHADWVKCLHPGWDLLVGWDDVQGSWREMFRSTEQMMISVSRPLVHMAGEAAWISCLENVTTAYNGTSTRRWWRPPTSFCVTKAAGCWCITTPRLWLHLRPRPRRPCSEGMA